MPSTLVTVDPGNTVGYSIFDLAPVKLRAAFEAPWHGFNISLEEFLNEQPGGAVQLVVEKYTITTETAKKSPQPRALMVTGVVEHLALRAMHSFDNTQQPATAMKMATDDVLKGLGWWRPTTGGHINDALRHAVVWLLNNLYMQPSEVLDAID